MNEYNKKYKTKADGKCIPNIKRRKEECERVRIQFPDKIPIICEKAPKSKIQEIDKKNI